MVGNPELLSSKKHLQGFWLFPGQNGGQPNSSYPPNVTLISFVGKPHHLPALPYLHCYCSSPVKMVGTPAFLAIPTFRLAVL